MPPGSCAGPAERRAEDQVGVGSGPPRRAAPWSRSWPPGPSRSSAAPCPRAGPVPVVSFSHVPAPVGVAGTRSPGAPTAPADHSGTGVASRPTEPSKPASSLGEHTLTDASSRSATNFSNAACRLATSASLSFLRLAASSFSASTLSLASGEGSMSESTRWNR